MKRLTLIFMSLLFFTGCESTPKVENLKCQTESDFVGEKIITEVVAEIQDDHVTSATMTMRSDKEETISELCSVYNVASDSDKVECKEKEIVLKDYDKMINQDGLIKEQILDYLNDHNFKCQ